MAYTKKQLQSIIDEAAHKHGVNADHLKIIAGIESSYNPKALGAETRSGRASGLFQFTPATAKGYNIADPTDPVQAADGAARYWKDLSNQFDGKLPLMIAQYNGGNSGVRAAKKGQVFEETAGYYEKFNKQAKAQGLAAFINTDDYAVIPRAGSKKPTGKPSAQPEPNPTVASKGPTTSFIDGKQDFRKTNPINADTLGMAQAHADYIDENATFGQDVEDVAGAIGAGYYTGNLAVQGLDFLKDEATQQKKPDDGWETEATDEYVINRLKEAKVPREGWDYVLEGVGDRNSFDMRLQRSLDAQERQAAMGKSLTGSIIGLVAGGITDPTFWLSGAAGALVTAGRATRAVRLARGAAAGAVTDASLGEIVGSEVDANYNELDIVINAVGGSIGGAVGAAARGSRMAQIADPTEAHVDLPEGASMPSGDAPPVAPEVAPVAPRQPEAPIEEFAHTGTEAPIVNGAKPHTAPWDSSWDNPERVAAGTRGGEKADTLLVPPNLDFKGTARYIATHGSDREKAMINLLGERLDGVRVGKMGVGDAGELRVFDDGGLSSRKLEPFIKDTRADMDADVNVKAWAYRAVPNEDGGLSSMQFFKNGSEGANGRKSFTAEAFIHETLHSATSRWVADIKTLKALPNPSATQKGVIKALDELTDVFNNFRNTANNLRKAGGSAAERAKAGTVRDAYGFTDLDEFIAEFASLPFEKSLAKLDELAQNAEATGRKVEVRALKANLKRALKGMTDFLRKVMGKPAVSSTYVDGYQAAILKVLDATNVDAIARISNGLNKANLTESPLAKAMQRAGEGNKTLDDFVKEHGGGDTFGKEHGAFTIEAIFQNKDMPVEIKALGAKLVGATTGYRNGEVVGRNVWDDTVALRDSQQAAYIKGHTLIFEKYWRDKNGSGVKAALSPLHKEAARKAFDDAVYRAKTSGQVHPDKAISDAVAFNTKFYNDWIDRINNPSGAEGGYTKGLTEVITEEVDEATGAITRKVSGTLEKDDTYAPFNLNVAKLNEVFHTFGSKKVHEFLEGAFYKHHPDLEAVAKAGGKQYGKTFSEWYLKQVLDSKVNRKFDYMHSMETSANGDDMIKAMVDEGMDLDVATTITESLIKKGDGSKAFNSSLRRRAAFDRQHEVTYEDGKVLSMYDLVDTDISRITSGYIGRMSGAVSLSKHFDGAGSLSDITRLFQEAKTRQFGIGQMSDAKVQDLTKAFESSMAHILGRQVEDPSVGKMVLSSLRNLNIIRLLGGAVLYQIAELAQVVGTVGLHNTLRAMPELSESIFRSKKTGKVAHSELDFYEDHISGSGIDMLKYIDIRRDDAYEAYLGTGKWAKRADDADFMLRKGAAGLLKYTGMTGALVMEKRLVLIALTRHFQDAIIDGKKLVYNTKRLATAGMGPEQYEAMATAMRKFSSKTDKGRHKLDTEGWSKEDPETFATWKVFLQRESRRTVQENDLGSHMHQMDNSWVKTFLQFRTFVLQAHSKALLYGVNHKDAQTATTLMYAIGMGTMMQYARALSKSASMTDEERKEYLDKALKFGGAGGVLARGIASTSQAALMPQLFDTFSPFGNLFDGYRSTTDSSELWANPTADLIDNVFRTGKEVGYLATGQDTLDQRDANAMIKLLPFNNALGVSQALGVMTNLLPKSSKAELLFDTDD